MITVRPGAMETSPSGHEGAADLEQAVFLVEGELDLLARLIGAQHEERGAEAVAEREDLGEKDGAAGLMSSSVWGRTHGDPPGIVAAGDGLDRRRRGLVARADQGPLGGAVMRAAGAEDADRHMGAAGGAEGAVVRLLGAGAGQLQSLGEREGEDTPGGGDLPRVGGHHAVHVGPDLHLFGAEGGADDGGGEVRALLAERGGDAAERGAHVAAHHRHPPRRQMRQQRFAQARVGLVVDRQRPVEGVVRDEDLAAVDPGGFQVVVAADPVEGEREDRARQQLAERGDAIGGLRRQAALRGDGGDGVMQLAEPAVEHGVEDPARVRRHHGAPDRLVVGAHLLEDGPRRRDVEIAGRRGVGALEQAPCRLRHRRHHDHRAAGEQAAHDAHHPLDRFGAVDRAAAELEDDHEAVIRIIIRADPRCASARR